MRSRQGYSTQEHHGKVLRNHDFVADGTKDAGAVCAAVEAATGLRWQGHPLGQHGYITTSERPDGSLFVTLTMYEDCDGGGGCGAKHPPHVKAGDLSPDRLAEIKAHVGEHPKHKLGVGKDAEVLTAIGLGPDTHPHLH